MKLGERIKNFFNRDNLGATGDETWINKAWDWNFWQEDNHGQGATQNTAVESCVSAIAQTIAMMPLAHWKINPDGGKQRLTGDITKLLRRPNGYQTQTDFILNLIRSELLTGNGVAYATRGSAGQISGLHLIPGSQSMPYIDPETLSVFYSINGNPLIFSPAGVMIPAADILHIRSNTPNHPLIGETPLFAAGMAAMAGNQVQSHNAHFTRNMARPSGTLMTDLKMNKAEVDILRESWKNQTTGKNAGGTPILTHALQWNPMAMTAVDAQMIEMYRMTVLDIARVFRVPPTVIGIMESATFNNVETLMKQWLSTGLGYTIRHIEEGLDRLFDLPPNEEIMFDTEILLRSDFKARMDGLSKGVTAGIFSPNEARRKEGLPEAEHGDEPRLQQQVVPLSFHYRPENIETTPEPEAAPDPEPISDEDKTMIAAQTIKQAMH